MCVVAQEKKFFLKALKIGSFSAVTKTLLIYSSNNTSWFTGYVCRLYWLYRAMVPKMANSARSKNTKIAGIDVELREVPVDKVNCFQKKIS